MRLVETIGIVPAIVPVDLSAAAADGDYVSLKNYGHVAIVVFKAAGTAGDDPDFSVQQAQAVAGTGAKDLLFTTIYQKQGVLTAVGTFVKITQAAGAAYSADLTSAEEQGVYVIEFDAQDLDVDNGFDCIRVRVADVGLNAQLGCAFYLLSEPRYGGDPVPSAIVD